MYWGYEINAKVEFVLELEKVCLGRFTALLSAL